MTFYTPGTPNGYDAETPPFHDLPATSHPDLRLIGSIVMDEEQYRVERWHRRFLGDHAYWAPTVEGTIAYSELRKAHRAARKETWQMRTLAEDEYSEQIMSMVDGR